MRLLICQTMQLSKPGILAKKLLHVGEASIELCHHKRALRAELDEREREREGDYASSRSGYSVETLALQALW